MADVHTQNQQKYDSMWNVRFLLDTTSIMLYCLLYSINSDTVCQSFIYLRNHVIPGGLCSRVIEKPGRFLLQAFRFGPIQFGSITQHSFFVYATIYRLRRMYDWRKMPPHFEDSIHHLFGPAKRYLLPAISPVYSLWGQAHFRPSPHRQ